ncbi:hypothetical protein [Burkholderia stagnalis]|uniref:hypothetical protein n=1 Tax=Burkholderia stagnalis TaxID=1503054 RepID=UPI0018C82CF9|nr:hypothetical protein [Burkholderia stagnalis]
MLFLLVRGGRAVNERAADSSIQAIRLVRPGLPCGCSAGRVAKGEKKPPGSPAVFSGILVALHAPSTLSIRQRSEMPEKVKVKLGGHDGDWIRQKS